MDTEKMSPGQLADTSVISANHQHAREKAEDYQIEAVVKKFSEVNTNTLSYDALTWKSKAVRRLALVIFIQGLSLYPHPRDLFVAQENH